MAHYVCGGAKLKCSMGSQKSELSLTHPSAPVSLFGKPMAAITDHKPMVNIKPFGQCSSLANPTVAAATAAANGKLQEMPCVPNTPSPWIAGKPDVFVKGAPALMNNSLLTCAWLGMIEIDDPGQKSVTDGYAPPQKRDAANMGDITEGKNLTVKDFAEILETIERERSYDAARHYASSGIDYHVINKLARRFVNAPDDGRRAKESDNDPNLMPTRFMLLYGADDNKLRGQGGVDAHPDAPAGAPKHEMSVGNLRKALSRLGYEVEAEGHFDDPLYHTFLRYLGGFNAVSLDRVSKDDSDSERPLYLAVKKYGLASWRYFCKNGGGPNVDHDRVIEELNHELGDRLLTEKGASPHDYKPGVSYRYPWVSLRVTTAHDKKAWYDGRISEYRVFDRGGQLMLAEGRLLNSGAAELLLPDAGDFLILIDGEEARQ